MGLLLAWLLAIAAAVACLLGSRRTSDRGSSSGTFFARLAAVLILAAVSIGTVIATSPVTITAGGILYDCGNVLSASHLTENSDTTPLDAEGLACKHAGRTRVDLGRNVGLSLAALTVLITGAGSLTARANQNKAVPRGHATTSLGPS